MAVYTPRGLKIRLSPRHCFTLISRLYPKVTAYKVLTLVEGLDSIIDLLPFLFWISCLLFDVEPLITCIIVAIGAILAYVISFYGLYIFPGLVTVSLIFSYLSCFYIHYLAVIVLGIVLGWKWSLAFFVGRIVGGLINHIIFPIIMKRQLKKYGITFGISEREFFNAYRLKAQTEGKTININLTDIELNDDSSWKVVFQNYAETCPSIASKCSES